MELKKIKKIAFLGYDFFYSSIESLAKSGIKIGAIYTWQDCDNIYNFNEKVIKLANEVGAELKFDRITEKDIEELSKENYDLIISAAYPYKIPVVSSMPPCINVHPSLLPNGKGPWPLPLIILKDLNVSGVTIHKINEEFDSGDILIQESFKVDENENLETLSCKVQICANKLLLKLVNDFSHYWDNSKPQSKGEYWRMPTFDDRQLDWNKSVKEIDRISRAFGKFDSLATFNNTDWIVQDLSIWEENHTFIPGTVVHTTNKEVVIAALDGFVCLRFFKIDPDFI